MTEEELAKHATARGWDEHLSAKVLGVMDRHGVSADQARAVIADAAILRVVHGVRDEAEAERQAAERALSGRLEPMHATEKVDLSQGAGPRHSSENAGGAVSIEGAYAHRQQQFGGGAGAPSVAQSQAADHYERRRGFFGGTA
jgi:hypothetical protein